MSIIKSSVRKERSVIALCHCLPVGSQHQPAGRVLTQHRLVGYSVGERGGSKANTLLASIVDRIEAFEEGLTAEEVETLACVRAKIADDEVDAVGSTTEEGVEGTGPDLSIGGQLKGSL